jgi:hypothetical protein
MSFPHGAVTCYPVPAGSLGQQHEQSDSGIAWGYLSIKQWNDLADCDEFDRWFLDDRAG